jgi:hypothetical protein
VDQTARNIQEYDRLLEEHPNELNTVVSRGRVLGSLMPTRAFGKLILDSLLVLLIILKYKIYFEYGDL